MRIRAIHLFYLRKCGEQLCKKQTLLTDAEEQNILPTSIEFTSCSAKGVIKQLDLSLFFATKSAK